MAAETVPVTMTEDAEGRASAVAISSYLERMIEHARETIPDLRQLRVTLEYDPACPLADPQIVIWAHRNYVPPEGQLDPTDGDYAAWQTRTFPPHIFVHVLLLSVYGDVDEW